MSLPICRFFLNGHCKLKSQCPKSHKILTCFLGPYCKSSNCSFRHPKNCENFLLNGCNYSSCNHFHPPAQLWYNHTLLPPIVHPPHQPPYHPPSGIPHSSYPSPTPSPSHVPLQPNITYSSELSLLKTKVQQLVTELESIKSNIQTQDHENGSSENVTVNDTLTIQNTTTGSAPTDIQEEGAGSDPIQNQEKHTESPPTKVSQRWWRFSKPSKIPPTSGAQKQKDLEIVPIQGECLEEVMLAQEAKKDIPNDNHQLEEEIDNKPDLGATITQEELSNLTSKINAIEISQQEIKTSQQKFAEGRKRWAKEVEDHLGKLEKDIDIIEDWATQEISALEKRLKPTITSLEQRVKTMEAGLQNMKPELGAAPSDKEALDRVVATQQELQTAPTEANEENTVEEACKNYSTEVKSNIQNIEKKHNETVEYLRSLAYSYVEILKLLSDLERCRSFRELSNRIAKDTPIFIEYEYLSSNLNYLKCFNGQK